MFIDPGRRRSLEDFDAGDTLAFFESMGLYTKERDGYVYPMSEQAATVRDVLCWELAEHKADVVTGQEVKDIKAAGKGPSKSGFTIYTAKEIKVTRYVLKDIKEISGGVRKGETVVFDLKQNEKGSAVFVNEKKEWQDWSDDSYCENVIPGKAGDAK